MGNCCIFPVEPQKTEVGVIDEQIAGGEIPVPEPHVGGFECDLEALIGAGVRRAGSAGFARIVDQRQAALAQQRGIQRLPGVQFRDQRLDFGVRPKPEGLRQQFIEIAIHGFTRASRTLGRSTPVADVGRAGDY